MNETNRNHGGRVNLCSYLLRHSRNTLLAAAIGIAASASAATLSLTSVDTSRRITDGTIVTGTLSANVKLTIADGATVKGKKSAVMTTIEVTPPGNPDSQFFKVKFGE